MAVLQIMMANNAINTDVFRASGLAYALSFMLTVSHSI